MRLVQHAAWALLLGSLFSWSSASPVHAQEQVPAGVTSPPRHPAAKFAARAVTGYIGEVLGMVAIGTVGYHLERQMYSCGCDDPGLHGLIIGGMLGAIMGASVGAALPEFSDDRCSFGRQVRVALVGGAVVAVPGVVLLGMTRNGGILVAGSLLLGPIASAAALSKC